MVRIRPGTVEDAVLLWKAEVETASTAGRLVSRPHELLLEAFQVKLRELGRAAATWLPSRRERSPDTPSWSPCRSKRCSTSIA
jgi:hypothetical protein